MRTGLDSRQTLASLVEQEGFPVPPGLESPGRLLQGPHVCGGDLCDLLPGWEAIALVSPHGEKIVLQADGRVTFHVPPGWRLMVSSLPIRTEQVVTQTVDFDGQLQQCEQCRTVTRLDHIPLIYQEAEGLG
ncbi:MAG: hypothetical protein AB7S38_29825 [Vulcanimicrobiota bacterium]